MLPDVNDTLLPPPLTHDAAEELHVVTTGTDTAEAEGGFEDYVELTTDTGYVPLLIVVLFGLLTHFVLLPLLVVVGRRRQQSRRNVETDPEPETRTNEQEQRREKRRQKRAAHQNHAHHPQVSGSQGGEKQVVVTCERNLPAEVHHNDFDEECALGEEEKGQQVNVTLAKPTFSATTDDKEEIGNDDGDNVNIEGQSGGLLEWIRHLADRVFILRPPGDNDTEGDRINTDNFNASMHDGSTMPQQQEPPSILDAGRQNVGGRRQRLDRNIAEEARYSVMRRLGEDHFSAAVLLLMEPSTRLFEIVRVAYDRRTASIGAMLDKMKVCATLPTFRRQNYVAVMRQQYAADDGKEEEKDDDGKDDEQQEHGDSCSRSCA